MTVTKQNYQEKARRFNEGHGGSDNDWPVIDAAKDTDAMLAWAIYYRRIGMAFAQTQLETMIRNRAGKWSVPSKDPGKFDRERFISKDDREALRAYLTGDTDRDGNTVADRRRIVTAALKPFRGAAKRRQDPTYVEDPRAAELAEARERVLSQSNEAIRRRTARLMCQPDHERAAVEALRKREKRRRGE